MVEAKKEVKKAPAAKVAAPKKAPAAKKAPAEKKTAPKKPAAKAKPEVAVEVKKTRSAAPKKEAPAAPAPEPKLAEILKKPASAAPAASPAPKAPKGKDKLGRTYATGKRKSSIARVWLSAGKGKIMVNGKDFEAYFRRPVLQLLIVQPFQAAGRAKSYDVNATLNGGGLSGQAGALKHGISRALALFEPELRGVLKAGGFLTRDSRVVERKHYGHKKARKSFQFSKR